jgi:hypothetical protein
VIGTLLLLIGAFTVILVSVIVGLVAVTDPNNTDVTFPKLDPVIVTTVFLGPLEGVKLVMIGKGTLEL